jgi:Ca-activated chloride channel family protein
LVTLVLIFLLVLDARPADPADTPIELLFLYGSEKQDWLNEATRAFHASNPVLEGRPIHVKPVPLGSGETVLDVLSGRQQAHLISPASGAYLDLGDYWSRKKGDKPLVLSKRKNLVLSPVVIAMWKKMANALGWPQQEIGWEDLRALAREGWASKGYPNWGPFRFGHTHPESSNSGLITVLSEVYAAAKKKQRLTQGGCGGHGHRCLPERPGGFRCPLRRLHRIFRQEDVRRGPQYLQCRCDVRKPGDRVLRSQVQAAR